MHIVERPARLYLPQLDVMRFCAFLAVFSFHLLPTVVPATHAGSGRILALLEQIIQRSGANGVGLFFLLSAFLITKLLTIERESTGNIHLKQFFARRALRIWPLYYLVLGIGLALQPLRPEFVLPRDKVLSSLLFYLNWNVGMHGFVWNPIFPLWTVSCEEQFYAVWPLLMKLVSPRKMRLACLLILWAVIMLAFPAYTMREHPGVADIGSMFIFFPMGGMLALMLPDKARPWRAGYDLLGVLGGLALWGAGTMVGTLGAIVPPLRTQIILGKGIVACGTVLIFFGFYQTAGSWWPKELIYLGKISYGLYVYHVMMLVLVGWIMPMIGMGIRTGAGHSLTNLVTVLGFRMPVALGLTMLVSGLSYRYFETPFLRLKDHFAMVHSRPV